MKKIVIDMAEERFREWNFKRFMRITYLDGAKVKQVFEIEQAGLLNKIQEFVSDYRRMGMKLTNRQMYYRLVASGIIPNAQEIYKRICVFLTDARYGGRLDWNAFEDRGRVFSRPSQWSGVSSLMDSAIASYRLPRWEDQNYHVELYCEKQALEGVLKPVADKYHIYFGCNKGYSSASSMYELAMRIKWQMQVRGKKARIIYCMLPDQTILHKGGYDNITDINIGQDILGQSDYVSVMDNMNRDYDGKSYTIHATSLLPIQVTAEHPMKIAEIQKDEHPTDKKTYRKFISSEFIEAKNIKEGQYLEVCIPKLDESEQSISFDIHNTGRSPEKLHSGNLSLTKGLARLMGFYLGNGSQSGATCITFNAKHKDKIAFYQELIKTELGYDVGMIEQNGALHMRFGGTVTERIFRQNFGASAHTKKIPDFIMNSKRDIVSEFITGYSEADGCMTDEKHRKLIRISTCSEGLALQLQMLCLGKYKELISVFKQVREEAHIIKGYHTYQLDKYEMHIYGQSLNTIFNIKYDRKIGRKKWFVDNGHIYVPITEIIESDYRGQVYNFTTSDHTITINNAISHNCGDHDPSGLDMIRDIRDRITEFLTQGDDPIDDPDFKVIQIALNMEQVREHSPPANPTKTTDSRAKWYISKYGDESWELDALPPELLTDLTEDAISDYLDKIKYDAHISKEERQKVALIEFGRTLDEKDETDLKDDDLDDEED